MINIGSLAGIDHLALIAASILRINSSRAVIKHQMPLPTLLPEHFTAHLGWAGAGPERGNPVPPEDAIRQSGNPSASPNPGGNITSTPGDLPPWKTITVASLLPVLEWNFPFCHYHGFFPNGFFYQLLPQIQAPTFQTFIYAATINVKCILFASCFPFPPLFNASRFIKYKCPKANQACYPFGRPQDILGLLTILDQSS